MHPNNSPLLTERAPAKINLDLRVIGRRPDGYHLLDSLVVFADCGDVLDYYPQDSLTFEIEGPYAKGLEADESNLVCRAIKAFSEKSGQLVTGRFVLTKNLPVASGIGGGSADAAAALRLLTRLWPERLTGNELEELALSLGADVPACLRSRPLRMEGTGEKITELKVDFPLNLLLVNPGVPVETATIFGDLKDAGFSFSSKRNLPTEVADMKQLLRILHDSRNDLQAPASLRVPEVAALIVRLNDFEGGCYAGMSGSGATCFALFESMEAADRAGKVISMDAKNYWVETCRGFAK